MKKRRNARDAASRAEQLHAETDAADQEPRTAREDVLRQAKRFAAQPSKNLGNAPVQPSLLLGDGASGPRMAGAASGESVANDSNNEPIDEPDVEGLVADDGGDLGVVAASTSSSNPRIDALDSVAPSDAVSNSTIVGDVPAPLEDTRVQIANAPSAAIPVASLATSGNLAANDQLTPAELLPRVGSSLSPAEDGLQETVESLEPEASETSQREPATPGTNFDRFQAKTSIDPRTAQRKEADDPEPWHDQENDAPLRTWDELQRPIMSFFGPEAHSGQIDDAPAVDGTIHDLVLRTPDLHEPRQGAAPAAGIAHGTLHVNIQVTPRARDEKLAADLRGLPDAMRSVTADLVDSKVNRSQWLRASQIRACLGQY